MIILNIEEIISLHEKMIQSTGGSIGLRDRGLLESAVFGAQATFDNQEIYKTIYEKVARLAFSIIKNHPFVDGNKRTGIFVMLVTLRFNEISIKYTQAELINLGLSIADSSIGYDDILTWVLDHLN